MQRGLRVLRRLGPVVLAVVVAGCSSTGRKAVYEGVRPEKPLEVPPELSLPRQGHDTAGGTGSATWSGYLRGAEATGTAGPVPAPPPPGVRLERDGALRWLVIDAPPQQVWERARAFLEHLGFEIKRADRRLGVLETNWQENKADVPANWFSRLLSKLYSSGLMDRYRVRIEPAEGGGSLVFIAHRGLREVVSGGDSDDIAVTEGWTLRDPDPELELEMLQEFAAFYAGEQAARQVAAQAASGGSRGRLEDSGGSLRLVLDEGFDRAWRLVQIGLDRLGVEVVDRDRSAGRFIIVLPEELRPQEGGWFSRLLGGGGKQDPGRLVLSVSGDAGRSQVGLSRDEGGEVDPALVRSVLEHLLDAMR